MQLNAQVGKQSNANGGLPTVRAAREGELIVTHNHGDYYQKVSEGDGFTLSTPLAGILLAATHTTATLGATATPLITIFNGGTFNIAINREFVGTLSGTPGGASYWWAIASGQQASALTLLTDTGINARTLTPDSPSGVKIGYGKALTGLTGALLPYRPLAPMNNGAAGYGFVERETKGGIIIPPGGLLALMAPNIGTTHSVHASVDITKIEVTA